MEQLEMASTGRVCYVHCNLCNTMLAVSVPCSSRMVTIATVRCGHCGNLLSVNMGVLLLQTLIPPFNDLQAGNNNNEYDEKKNMTRKDEDGSSSSKCKSDHLLPMPAAVRPPEKRQRVPSTYNRFIKAEIQRIKANKPEISHREAFSAAAKNWAHFPNIHFGLKLAKIDHSKGVAAAAAAAERRQLIHRTNGFY